MYVGLLNVGFGLSEFRGQGSGEVYGMGAAGLQVFAGVRAPGC